MTSVDVFPRGTCPSRPTCYIWTLISRSRARFKCETRGQPRVSGDKFLRFQTESGVWRWKPRASLEIDSSSRWRWMETGDRPWRRSATYLACLGCLSLANLFRQGAYLLRGKGDHPHQAFAQIRLSSGSTLSYCAQACSLSIVAEPGNKFIWNPFRIISPKAYV